MNFKIKHLQYYLKGEFDLIPKSLGVELVELGFCNYKKLTPENYYYWWCEVSEKSKIDNKAFTFNWIDLIPTGKMALLKEFIQYHKENESMYKLIEAILNIEASRFDGFDLCTGKLEFVRQIELYYGNRKRQIIQLQFNFA